MLVVSAYFAQIVGLITPFDSSVLNAFQKLNVESLSQREAVIKIYNYVSSFEYVSEDTKDNWQLPASFLKTKKGDCEEFSSLSSSLYYQAGVLNYLIFSQGKPGANWKQRHVANLVMFADASFLYLDASYPHQVGKLPFYKDQAEVFNILSFHSPLLTPFLSLSPQPLTVLSKNIPILKLVTLQL